MILFFRTPQQSVIATQIDHPLSEAEVNELCWLYGDATPEKDDALPGWFVGPRREMITPWSTNAVEITQNMNLCGITRIEEYFPVDNEEAEHDPMLQRMYNGLDQNIFTVNIEPAPIQYISDLETYNEQEGLALSPAEIDYLHGVEQQLGRQLTDSEVFGFAQINSEHCRHKIFGGSFIIDGKEMPSSLFAMIKKTTKENPHHIISAYKDNVAFAEGPVVEQFAPADHATSDYFRVKDIESVISIKAETDTQLPHDRGALQRRIDGYGRRNPRPYGRRRRLMAHCGHRSLYDGLPAPRRRTRMGGYPARTSVALPDTRANPHQSL